MALAAIVASVSMGSLPARAGVVQFAIVVGNNAPENTRRSRLRYADDDALAVHQLLRQAGVRSVLLVSPDQESKRLVAAGGHVLSDPGSAVPMVGASGAISAIMGAYLLLYPKARVHSLFIIIIIIRVFPLPAWFFLLYWFFIQVASSRMQGAGASGGVAFWAHIGGFLAGVALVKLFQNRVLVDAKRSKRQLTRGDIRGGGWW